MLIASVVKNVTIFFVILSPGPNVIKHLLVPHWPYIRLGWNSLTGTNALAYYEKSKLTAVKCFASLAAGQGKTLCNAIS